MRTPNKAELQKGKHLENTEKINYIGKKNKIK